MKVIVIDSRKYPFLRRIEEELAKFHGGVSLYELLNIDNYYLQKAKERVEAIRAGNDPEPYREMRNPVIVFYVTLCLVISSQDELLKLKFIEKETKTIANQLLQENEEALVTIAQLLGVNVKFDSLLAQQAGKTIQFSFSMGLNELIKILGEAKREEELSSNEIKITSQKAYLTRRGLVTILLYRIKELFYEMVYGDKLGTLKNHCR